MLCSKCQKFCEDAAKEIRIPDEGNAKEPLDASHVRWGQFSTVLHHNLHELKTASDQRCPICRIIYSKSLRLEMAQLLEACTIVLEIKPEIGPDQAHPLLSTTFRENGRDLIKLQIAGYFKAVVDDDLAHTLSKCAELDNRSTGSDASFRLAKFWLNRCLKTHDSCSRPRLSQPFMPSRVLDVSAGMVRLIETKNESIAEADKKFIALSHCWGSFQIITTSKSSFESRLKGIRTDQLSQTFLDAITVTRNLSYRYLWIDSLCIIQDDDADWNKEAAQMCDVYQAAELTILAAHASGGNIGCFRKRDGILQLPFILKFPMKKGENPAISAVQAIFAPYSILDDAGDPYPPLYGRAWVLQEQLLSPRKLIFEGGQLKWECLCTYVSERSPSGRSRLTPHEIVKNSIANGEDFFHKGDYGNSEPHLLWYKVITDYTTRGITKPSDRLAAISGIANSLRRKTTNQYLAGLWRDQLLHGLLWSIPHIIGEYGSGHLSFDMDRNESIRHTNYIAPTWSWASVTAPVLFNYNRLQDLCKIQVVNGTGSAACQTERLEIFGHIRVAFVNSVYPYAIREAAGKYANMQCTNDSGKEGQIMHCGRSFFTYSYFLCSQKLPRKDGDWQLICGYWRPDEVLDPNTEITFIAIGQFHWHSSTKEGRSYESRHPLEVLTLGLVPTGRAANEYRRVGYGVWRGFAWYGYSCDFGDAGRCTIKSCSWQLFWMVMEKVWGKPPVGGLKVQHAGGHENPLTADGFPKKELYHDSIKVRTERLVTV